MTNERVNLYYDPSRNGYDTTIWKTVDWTPTLSTNKIDINGASMIGYDDFMSGDLIMSINIPAVPTTWDSRFFGFWQINNGSCVGFDITDDVFKAKIVDSNWVSILSDEITWNSDWTAANTNFGVNWTWFSADFYINDIKVATIANVAWLKYPLSMYFKNSNTDVMSVFGIQVKNASMNRWGV